MYELRGFTESRQSIRCHLLGIPYISRSSAGNPYSTSEIACPRGSGIKKKAISIAFFLFRSGQDSLF